MLGGLAAGLGGVLFLVWGYLDRDGASSYFTAIENTLDSIVPLLFLVGLVGLYARCKGRTGWIGGTGFALSFVGAVVGILYSSLDIWACCDHVFADLTQRGVPIILLDWLFWLFIGLTIVGIATGRKLGWGWGALSLSIVLFGWPYYLTEMGLGHVVFGILFGLSWVVLGYALWSEGLR
jgi:hypothetical protein